MQKIPGDNQIRKWLDSVAPTHVFPGFGHCVEALPACSWLDNLRRIGGTLFVPFDGTQFFSAQKSHGEHCSTRQYQGKATDCHQVVTPVIVAPNRPPVMPLAPEFIEPQEGSPKPDCELNASKRWLPQWAS